MALTKTKRSTMSTRAKAGAKRIGATLKRGTGTTIRKKTVAKKK